MLAAAEPAALRLGQFVNQIANGRRYFGAQSQVDFVLPAFVDNHDMNRFLWVAGGDKQRLRLALGLLFGLGGPPVIYYGTEAGLGQPRAKGPSREESRHPMLWGEAQDADLLRFVRGWVAERRRHPALGRGTVRTLYYREDAHSWLGELTLGDDTVLLAINAGSSPVEIPLPDGSYTTESGEGVKSTGSYGLMPLTVTCFCPAA
jgi:glycosidase